MTAELVVFIDGHARQITGAVEDSTTSEIVTALANANNKIGKFSLVLLNQTNVSSNVPAFLFYSFLECWILSAYERLSFSNSKFIKRTWYWCLFGSPWGWPSSSWSVWLFNSKCRSKNICLFASASRWIREDVGNVERFRTRRVSSRARVNLNMRICKITFNTS